MTTMDRFTPSRAPVKRVKAIQLGVWDPEEIKRYSVCHVESPELFEKGKPKAGGLSDPRMGTMDKFGGICTTDGANMHDCPGYFGHIELAEPVYHCGFIKTIIRILRCVGHYNSKILVGHDDSKYRAGLSLKKPQARLKHFVDICSGKRFDDAGGVQTSRSRHPAHACSSTAIQELQDYSWIAVMSLWQWSAVGHSSRRAQGAG
eukprot:GHUV01010134.1.p1 GENE.GHUV01010134.1~~GHUV01010134.1.p1  ORF type:complete len:204 (+),score=40.35 GHUV01010134.1:369-980(+)